MITKSMLEQCLQRLSKMETTEENFEVSCNFVREHEIEITQHFFILFMADLEYDMKTHSSLRESYSYDYLLPAPNDKFKILNPCLIRNRFEEFIRAYVPEELKDKLVLNVKRLDTFPPCKPEGTKGFEFNLNFYF